MTPKIDVIVPSFNESQRVIKTVALLLAVPHVKNIICVDDGSTDDSFLLLKKEFAHDKRVVLIRLPTNQGKAEAVKKGLTQVTTEYTLLFDADLQNVRVSEISWATKKWMFLYRRSELVDMVLFKRINSVPTSRVSWANLLLTGERIVKTLKLKKMYLTFKPTGYTLEMAINRYMRESGGRAYWTPLSATNTFKYTKYGLVFGVTKDVLMYQTLIGKVGFREYFRQVSWGKKLRRLS